MGFPGGETAAGSCAPVSCVFTRKLCTYVQDTRYGKYFEIFGDRSIHFGPYEGCGNAPAVDGGDAGCGCGGSCC